jgi:hypothetical protein
MALWAKSDAILKNVTAIRHFVTIRDMVSVHMFVSL